MKHIINLDRYPVDAPQLDSYRALMEHCQHQLAEDGALELPGFLTDAVVQQLVDHSVTAKLKGHRMDGLFPAYSDSMSDVDDPNLPEDHPSRIRLPASHRFIPGDLFADDSPLLQLYQYSPFVAFIRCALGLPALYPIDDKLGRINLLAYEPGDRNGWHFDATEFIVSLVLQVAEFGGDYHYIPGLRSASNENFAEVSSRMQNPDAPKGVQQVDLQAASLFLFKGKYTLHRVTEIEGNRDRVVAILSYASQPGHRLSTSSKLALYGRAS